MEGIVAPANRECKHRCRARQFTPFRRSLATIREYLANRHLNTPRLLVRSRVPKAVVRRVLEGTGTFPDLETAARALARRSLINAGKTTKARHGYRGAYSVERLPSGPSDHELLELREEQQARCARLLAHVSGTQRAVLQLDLEGKGTREIAKELRVTSENVNVLRHRAIQTIRSALGLGN
jgi:RNA polymerase sigma factor (sigma-70 family)